MPQPSLTPFNETQKAQHVYRDVWGGDDLHIGIYQPESLNLHEAGHQTTERMLKLLGRVKRSNKILVLQSGFGTAARYIAQEKRCKVYCLNNDKMQNAYNQGRIDELELSKVIKISEGDNHYMPYDPNMFDAVLAQDSFSINKGKKKMFRAIHRITSPEGRLIFSALMRSENANSKADKIIKELPVEELISQEEYQKAAEKGFFQQVYTLDLSQHLVTHFEKIGEVLQDKKKVLIQQSSEAFVKKRIKTNSNFLNLAKDGQLEWGILMFQKINA